MKIISTVRVRTRGLLFFILSFGAILLNGPNVLAIPPWAKSETQTMKGSIYEVVCFGDGPSLDFARKTAVNSCLASASRARITSFSVKSLTIQTEKDSTIQEEVSESFSVIGLNCKPLKEELEEISGGVKVWLKCQFDLSKGKIIPKSDENVQSKSPPEISEGTAVLNSESLTKLKSNRSVSSSYVKGGLTKVLNIASVPRCESILIHGKATRLVRCEGNPVQVTINSDDKSLTIRALNCLPKIVELRAGNWREDAIEVFLDLQ